MTFKNSRFFLGVFLISVLLIGAGCGVLQEPAAPSATLEAAPLELEEETNTTDGSEAADAETEESSDAGTEEMTDSEAETAAAETEEAGDSESDMAASEATAEPAEETDGSEATEPEAEATATAEPAAESEDSGTLILYEISPQDSQVRFEIDEVLRGNPKTVVGTTDQVSGQLAINFSDPSATQVGEIRINARTFVTDNQFRNRAIANEILETGDYEFITFVPAAVNGLPDTIAVGDTVEFTIVGDLTIRDLTTEVTFDVTATAVSETEISGTASTTVTREAYGIQIPEVPNVANVEDEVELYIDFVATAAE